MQKIINTIALLVIVWQVVNVFQPPVSASASSPYGDAVCFYPETARRTDKYTYQFTTANPTEKMYLVLGKTNPRTGGLVLIDDGGPSNATLNRLFPHLAK